MLGFQIDWDFECLVIVWTQIGVVLGLGFIAKQRSGFGFDYMSFALMRGNNPRTLLYPHVIKLVTQAFKVTISHFILSHYSLTSDQPTPLFLTKSKNPKKSLTIFKH